MSPDVNDIQYFSLALKMNVPIWSNDKKLKQQSKVKVFSTKDLIEFLSRI
ncbi:MAG: PIN domain-containing protein [Candidatus Aenigmatarchaeota archaeon]